VTRIFTTGYEQHAEPASLVETLRAAGVRRLVDVRELPSSRRRGFSKTALAAALHAGGIEYVHGRALGNPKPNRDLWRSGRRDEAKARYRAHLDTDAADALAALDGSLDKMPTCLLCLEADPADCHRTLVAEALAARRRGELAVTHLP
jgi:uncharacterized protein (DUF488 family)